MGEYPGLSPWALSHRFPYENEAGDTVKRKRQCDGNRERDFKMPHCWF